MLFMKKVVFLLLVAVGSIGCKAQQKNDNQQHIKSEAVAQTKPAENWKVNKKYDDKGNLIGYDSTYTWSYSSNGELPSAEADSLFSAFHKRFGLGSSPFFRKGFMQSPFSDSLSTDEFGFPDKFFNGWNNQFFDMSGLLQQMNALHNSFFQLQTPQAGELPKKTQLPTQKV